MSRMVDMIMRTFVRKAVNIGVDAGRDALNGSSKKGKKAPPAKEAKAEAAPTTYIEPDPTPAPPPRPAPNPVPAPAPKAAPEPAPAAPEKPAVPELTKERGVGVAGESSATLAEDAGMMVAIRVDQGDSGPGEIEGVLKFTAGGVVVVMALGVHDADVRWEPSPS